MNPDPDPNPNPNPNNPNNLLETIILLGYNVRIGWKFKLIGKGNYACMHVHETHNIDMQGFSKANGN